MSANAETSGFAKWLRRLMTIGLGAVIAASWIATFVFVSEQTSHPMLGWFMPLAIATIAVSSGFLFLFARGEREAGNETMAWMFTATGAAFMVFNFVTDFGAFAWQRHGNVQSATVQNVKFDNAQGNVMQARGSLKIFEKQLASLEEKHAWLPSVTANGLRAELANLQSTGDNRGRNIWKRSSNCTDVTLTDSRALCDRIRAKQSQIAAVEAKQSLIGRIEATKRIIAKHSAKADTMVKANSGAAAVDEILTRIRLMQFTGDVPVESREASSTMVGAMFAAMTTIAIALFAMVLFGHHTFTLKSFAAAAGGMPREIKPGLDGHLKMSDIGRAIDPGNAATMMAQTAPPPIEERHAEPPRRIGAINEPRGEHREDVRVYNIDDRSVATRIRAELDKVLNANNPAAA